MDTPKTPKNPSLLLELTHAIILPKKHQHDHTHIHPNLSFLPATSATSASRDSNTHPLPILPSHHGRPLLKV